MPSRDNVLTCPALVLTFYILSQEYIDIIVSCILINLHIYELYINLAQTWI